MSTISIPTTQNIELEYPVASLGDRILAWFVDGLIQLGYWLIVLWLTDIPALPMGEPFQIILFLPIGFYHLLCETFFDGQSLGKRILKTRVIRIDGSPPTLSNYLLRWMLRPIDILFYGAVAIITIAVTPKRQRLGDLAGGTSVIKLKLVTTFGETIFRETGEDYEVVFPEIQHLTDRDVSILKEVLDAGIRSANPDLIQKLALKVQEVTGIETRMHPEEFLETILKDYNHQYSRE